MGDAANGYVDSVTDQHGITKITFFHPAQNSLPANLLLALASAIEQAGNDFYTRVILLTSLGNNTFCAGASFNELLQIKDKTAGEAFFMGFANVINACRKSQKIIIGRVQGKAVGGGVGMAAAVDYCLATEAASIKLSELAIGIGPFVIAPVVIRKIGLSAFSQLTIRACDFQPAQWAKQNGLFNEVYTDITELDTAVDALLNDMATYHPEALASLKQVLWEGTAHWDDLLATRAAISGELVLSNFTQKALHQFLTIKK